MVIVPNIISIVSKNAIIFSIATVIVSAMNNDPTGMMRNDLKESTFFYPLLLILSPVIVSKIPIKGVGSLMDAGIPIVSSIVTATVAYMISKTVRTEGFSAIKKVNVGKEVDIKGFKIDMSHSYVIGISVLVDLFVQLVLIGVMKL